MKSYFEQGDLFIKSIKKSTSYLINSDCLDWMREQSENSIDLIVTDPPYGLNFMGKKWDQAIPNCDIWSEALRICKPGSMLAAFGGSRTHHHLMLAVEQAGWEIRDVIMWIYGSGFPKSHNFGRQMGGDWSDYGTALKPAYEPIIIAMKPLDGTFKENAEKWSVAGINVDGCRIETKESWKQKCHDITGGNLLGRKGRHERISESSPLGRWPANIIFDEEAAEELDRQSGFSKGGNRKQNIKTIKGNGVGQNIFTGMTNAPNDYSDCGGASRFFYCAKASSSERNRGLEGMPLKENMRVNAPRENENDKHSNKIQNYHPTVKPIALMKYIITLLAPPGSPTCLDPFMGSGTTGIACKELGINFIGIEKEKEYFQIAQARINSVGYNLT